METNVDMGSDAEAEDAPTDHDWSLRQSSSDEDDEDDEDSIEVVSIDSTGRTKDVDSRVRRSDLDALSRFLPPAKSSRPASIVEGQCLDEDEDDGKSFVCSFQGCTKVFGKPSRLETHMRTHTGERPFRCHVDGCDKAYARNQHLQRHLQAHDRETPEKRKKKSVDEEASGHRQRLNKFLLADSSKLKRATTSSSAPSFVCVFEGCQKQLASERSLKAHMNIHGGVRYVCDSDGCAQSYPTLKSLKRHQKETHQRSVVVCPDTPSEDSEWETPKDGLAKSAEDLEGGSSGGAGFKSYACASCGKSFKKHWQLKSHSFEHTGVLPFKCREAGCDRAFLFRSHLRRHVKQRHRLHRCQLHPECEAVFKSSLEARRHFQERHGTGGAKGKKKACPTCGKPVNSSYFKAHLETHREARTVFPCPKDDCRREFLAKKNLVAHLRMNHGERVDDGAAGSEEAGVVVEGKTTTSPPRLPCTFAGCAGQFVSKATRDRHVRNQHGEKAEESLRVRPRKCKPRKDFAKDLAGLGGTAHDGMTESDDRGETAKNGTDDEEREEEEDTYVLTSLNLPTRHDDLPQQ